MKLSELKNNLASMSAVNFIQSDGTGVPKHFHITEAGLSTKHFIDCGGTIRTEKAITFQVLVAKDVEHRLEPKKLLSIISKSEKLFDSEDLEIEVEYQAETIGKYGLDIKDGNFLLTIKNTNCLAQDHCGIPKEKEKLSTLATQNVRCTPGGGCC